MRQQGTFEKRAKAFITRKGVLGHCIDATKAIETRPKSKAY
jgi:hypothetical protein